eukprot:UN19729
MHRERYGLFKTQSLPLTKATVFYILVFSIAFPFISFEW